MPTHFQASNAFLTGTGYTFQNPGDSLVLLPNFFMLNPEGSVIHAADTLSDIGVTLFGTVASGEAIAVSLEAQGSVLVIGAAGAVSASHPTGAASAVSMSGGWSSFTNRGTVSSTSSSAGAVSILGVASTGVNHGVLSGMAHGLLFAGGGGFTNHGDIAGSAHLSNGVVLEGTATFVNTGRITVGASASSAAISGEAGGILSITNSGSILGLNGWALTAAQTVTLANTGLMAGAQGIALGSGHDRVTNTGRIEGPVDLGAGDDVFDTIGGTVAGPVAGGAGNDLYRIGAIPVAIVELAGGGQDTIEAAVDWDLGATPEVEALVLLPGGVIGSGNALDNQIIGNAARNRLYGGDGNDTAWGGAGDDLIHGGRGDDSASGGEGDDRIAGQAGRDTLHGDNGDDTLLGGGGNDLLYGGDGDDLLVAGGGRDRLWGGLDADIFQFRTVADSPVGSSLRDTVEDFEIGVDLIDLSMIDANTTVTGDQAFVWIGTGAFTGVAGQLRLQAGASSSLLGDVNGDGVADFEILMRNVAAMTDSDLIL
ncbi:MAG: M10 family metallopeptidase C-terminal domain-containing protein [Paracoccaceae bacterium]|nr:MAG: M10 family metallopeptidase C-terminal domain-containing protein [Paracoccaceae bacterium]